MRVLTVASEVPPVRSGVARAVGRVAAGLADRGHEVELRSYADARTLTTDRVRLSTLGVALGRRGIENVDLVHLHGPTPTVSDVLLGRRRFGSQRVPLVYTHHFTIAGEARGLDWAYRGYDRLSRSLAQNATAIVATTESYAGMLRRPAGPPVHVIPWGIDPFVAGEPRSERAVGVPLRVLVLGQMRRYKGHQVALEAVGGVAGIELTLAGGGPLASAIERDARMYRNVTVVIEPDDSRVQELYRDHDVIALPATNATEAFGIVLVEGMARGCVPVASDLPGVRDVARPTGRVVEPANPAALRSELLALAADPAELRRRAAASVEHGRALTWDRTVDAYDALVRAGRRPMTRWPRRSRTAGPGHARPSPWWRSPALGSAAAVLVLGGLVLVATFTQARGEVISDARYEHVAAPTQFVERHASVWDDQRTLGEPTKYFSPVVGSYQAVLERNGAPPWVIQRATHALLLFASAVGAWLVARLLVDRRLGWFLAGFAFAFNPYTTQFLVPSGLFTAYALAPWMAWAAVRGVRSNDPWRWAAAFAIAVFAMGMLNTSSLLLAMLPAAALVAVTLVSRESSWPAALGWIWRALVLSVGATAAMLVTLSLTIESVRFNLETTETPSAVAGTSAAGESWRGLGQWLSYFRVGQGQLRDQSTPYFTEVLVILATFVPLLVAAAALVLTRRRALAGLGILAASSVVIMIGIHPVGDPTPFGQLLENGFDSSLFMRGFRSTYKAGAGLQLAVAVLVGSAVAALTARGRPPRPRGRLVGRWLVALVAVAAIGVGTFPYWTGDLYQSTGRHEDVPDYWEDAFEWFDAQAHEPGVLILPSVARTPYRWGFVNDTLFDANLAQPAVSARTLPQSTPALADLTEWIEEYTASSAAQPGALGPILRRLGVRWVLLQNDVDWLAAGVPRPLTYDTIRNDPDFARAAVFGRAGRNIVGRITFDRAGVEEAKLTPIEVYEVVDTRPTGGVVTSSPVIVAGGGEAWPALAAAGWLASPIVYRGDLAPDELDETFAAAQAYVITDGGQRRAVRVAASQSQWSPVLGLGDDLGRPVQVLFDALADQTLATFGDVERLSATRFGRLFGVWDSAFRPANAMDGNPLTAWATDSGVAQTMSVQLAEPVDLRAVSIQVWGDEDPAPVSELTLLGRLGGVEVERVEQRLGDDESEVLIGFDAQVDSLAVTLVPADDVDGMVGIAELDLLTDVGPVDGREVLRTPGPLDSDATARLTAALGTTEVHHLFTRVVRGKSLPEQAVIAREFWSPVEEVTLTSHVRIDDTTPDVVIDHLLATPVSAVASTRFLDALTATARNVVDGNFATAWQFDPSRPADLTIVLPATRADQIEIWLVARGPLPFELSRMTRFSVRITQADGTVETQTVELDPDEPECDEVFATFGDGTCVERITLDFDARSVTGIRVEPLDIDESTGGLDRIPVQVADVRVRLGLEEILDPLVEPASGCRPLFDLDGVPVAVRPVESVTLDSLVRGVDFVSCSPVTLQEGWHRLVGDPAASFAVDTVAITPVGARGPRSDDRSVTTTRKSASHHRFETIVAVGDVVVTNVPDHRGWQVSADGVPGSRVSADGFVAWQASGDGDVVLDVRFGPQRLYRTAWFISALTIAVSVWLVLPTRRLRDD